MGCVRLTVEDAKWIYNNISSGTYVEFYSSSDPGPLGKPTAKKISDNTECRGWDPTDDNENNPWKLITRDLNENTIKDESNNIYDNIDLQNIKEDVVDTKDKKLEDTELKDTSLEDKNLTNDNNEEMEKNNIENNNLLNEIKIKNNENEIVVNNVEDNVENSDL